LEKTEVSAKVLGQLSTLAKTQRLNSGAFLKLLPQRPEIVQPRAILLANSVKTVVFCRICPKQIASFFSRFRQSELRQFNADSSCFAIGC